jgi:hypothetical protein
MERDECKCGLLARMAEDQKHPVEFDPRLNEYHFTLYAPHPLPA